MGMFDQVSLLRAFVSIVEGGSISAAARSLKLSQPTVSRQLAALESACGVALLRRDTHSMSLTESGHRLLADARAMLLLAEESEQRMRQEQHELKGLIRLFATIDFGQTMVSRLIASFVQANPAVTVELSLSNRALHMIQEGCDAGIIVGGITDESVVARPVGALMRYPAAAPALLRARRPPKAPQDLAAWPWLSLSGEQFGGAHEVTLFRPGGTVQQVPISPVMTSEGITSLREAARSGLGVAILPDWLAREDLAAGRLVRLLPKWRAKPLTAHVVYPGQRMLPVRVRAFIDFAVDYMVAALALPTPAARKARKHRPGKDEALR
jgi:DNA-binding transcriptional LysR family regulator